MAHSQKAADIPQIRRFDNMDFHFETLRTGRGARNELERIAERMKRDGRIRFYRIRPYDVRTRASPDGRYVEKRTYVLYVR